MVTQALAATDVVVRYATAPDAALPPNRRRPISWVPRKASPPQMIVAVDQVSLRVAAGEIVALLGPSGSGKSSLLRAVAGLEPLAGGTITWDGQDLARMPVHKRNFGLMFQEPALFPNLSVGGNVAYGLHGVPRHERAKIVAEFLELVDLAGFAGRPVTDLSGGQAQRVALARSLAPHPRMLLLDEPLSALDRGLRERLVGMLRDVLRGTSTTAMYVTHDHDEAFALADRVAVLAEGRLLQIDLPEALWRRPVSVEVARFLGYSTFLGSADAHALGVADLAATGAVGLSPSSLRLDPDGAVVSVRRQQVRRGHVAVSVTLPSGEVAELRLPDRVSTSEIQIGVDREAVALV
ncbi:MAG: ABC transporter ATP-binding protein, partial [Propioniciclava sp.]